MTHTDIENCLGLIRPVFHSEDDFKFQLATEIKNYTGVKDVHIEKPEDISIPYRRPYPLKAGTPQPKKDGATIDLVVEMNSGDLIPIELKYITDNDTITHGDITYSLKQHNSPPTQRYSIRKDICRLEHCLTLYKKNRESPRGFVLAITNKNCLTNNVSGGTTYDKNYSLHTGYRMPRNDPGWFYSKNCSAFPNSSSAYPPYFTAPGSNKKHWTCEKNQYLDTSLRNNYSVNWAPLSKVNIRSKPIHNMMYLLIEVRP